MNRRDFFKLGGAAGALAALAPLVKSKHGVAGTRATKSPRRLVLVMAQGGWDTTYALDPKVQSAKVDVPVGAVQQFGNLDVFTDASRPNVTAFFTKYAPQTAIVRGISVASVAHRECVKRMATGTREETNPDMGAIVAHDLGNDLPLPYLILGDTAFTGQYAVSAGRVGATNQIIALLDPNQAYPTGQANPFDPSDAEDALLHRYAQASVDRAKATRGAAGYNRRRLDDFVEAIDRGEALKPVRAGFGTRGRTLLLDSQVNLALDALQQDISRAVMLNTRLAWDTHTQNDDQAGFHESTFAGLTSLMDQLAARDGWRAGTKMIDDTVVVCFSEFSRTPKLNANMGKDHWPVTSALVMGAGIAGGRAYGQTTDDMQATPINVGGTQTNLMSQHFVGGVLAACGVDASSHLQSEVFDAFVA
ncbi:MAG: DUF1501 domain-containing protein [Deltaproteobacteria bacterium]|nr:DUF1501 domain-containing protein [Deltaproteobacteria bacterium]